jgi:flavin-dependent dehydrogenase
MALDPVPDLSRPYEVAIAGASLAGGSLALRLARAGVRVVLLDAARFPREKLCGEFLSPESWRILERLGLAEDVARSGYHPIRRVRLSTPRGRILDAEFASGDAPAGIGLSRAVLDDLIVRRAREAGADVIEGARVGNSIVRDGCVVGLSARRLDGEAFDVLASVTVAADGRHSALVRRTGTTRPRSLLRPRLFGMKRHVHVAPSDADPSGTVALHLLPGGYVGACRIESPFTNVCALLPESCLRHHRGQLDRLAHDCARGNPALRRLLDASAPAGDWKTVAGVRVESSFPSLPGILYAGDCQGTIDPLGGQGMTMALLGSEVLAPFVTAALASGAADASIQRAYNAAWHQRFDGRIALCRLFHHVLVNPRFIDVASRFKTLAPRLLASCFASTRDLRKEPNAEIG